MKLVTENNGLFNDEQDYGANNDLLTSGPEDEPLADEEIGGDDEPLTNEEVADDDLTDEDELGKEDELLGADSPDDAEEFGEDESAAGRNV